MIGKYYFNKTIHGFKLSAKRKRRIQIEFVNYCEYIILPVINKVLQVITDNRKKLNMRIG